AGSASTTIHVLNSDRAPVVSTSGSAFELTEGAPFSLGVTAADADGDAIASLTAAASPAPPGGAPQFTAAAGAKSGTLAWPPSFSDPGTYKVPSTAPTPRKGRRRARWNVATVAGPRLWSAPASLVAPGSGPLQLSFTVVDPDSDAIDSLTANLSELPAGN